MFSHDEVAEVSGLAFPFFFFFFVEVDDSRPDVATNSAEGLGLSDRLKGTRIFSPSSPDVSFFFPLNRSMSIMSAPHVSQLYLWYDR